jgi:hypothetical protein
MTDLTRQPRALGRRDWNFFVKLAVSSSSFATNCDVLIPFPPQTITFQLEGTGKVEYSFNQGTLHGDMENGKSSATLTFVDRSESKIWFRLVSGSPTIRIEAWGTP